VAIGDLSVDGNESAPRALSGHLHIVPVWTGLLVGRLSASPCILRDLSPRPEHRLTIAAFSIGRHSWRLLRMSTGFELRHQLEGHFFLGFGNGSSHAQSTL